MTSSEPAAAVLPRPRGERPQLFASNRRLRHLRAVSLRNLTLTACGKRPRGKTTDDDALPLSLSSPAKLVALSEERTLSHSQSSGNLKEGGAILDGDDKDKGLANGHPVTPQRPGMGKLRRSSTLEWTGTSPRQRQKKIQDAIAQHAVDCFFSLHVQGVDKPVYVSEVVKQMNPDFRAFDLSSCGPFVNRRDALELRFWTKSNTASEWRYFIDLTLDLARLHFIGTSLENFTHALPNNCVLFHFIDGIYAHLPDVFGGDDPFITPKPKAVSSGLLSGLTVYEAQSSSYDALMRLSTLDSVIQDALSTQFKLAGEISKLLDGHHSRSATSTDLKIATDTNAASSKAVESIRQQTAALKAQVKETRASLHSRRKSAEQGRVSRDQSRKLIVENEQQLRNSRMLHSKVKEEINGQRRRICTDLLEIYPVDPVPAKTKSLNNLNAEHAHSGPLAFTIHSLPLPNSEFISPQISASAVSAALGHVARTTQLLSLYFSIPIPYPITFRASTSSIHDPVSLLMDRSRDFPLYVNGGRADSLSNASGGTSFYRFEYGVYLLNKDIELLASKLGLKVLDIRQTLPNLKYLFFVATAGHGDAPSRKAGGLRGLLKGLNNGGSSGGTSLTGSRRGSDESAGGGSKAGGMAAAEAIRKKLEIQEQRQRHAPVNAGEAGQV